MLSSNELSYLYKIISDENQTFENISQKFFESFNETDYMRIAMTLYILIKDNLFNKTQRIISFYILYLLKRKFNYEISPVFPLILETIQRTNYKIEQNFLIDFVNNQIDYINTTVKHFLNDNSEKNNHQNIHYFQMLYNKYQLEKGIFGASPKIYDHRRYVLYDRKKSEIKNLDNHTNVNLDNYIKEKEEITFNFCTPNYLGFYPLTENKKFIDSEPRWLMPGLKHNFIWEGNKKNEKEKEEEKK
jgi:hypothetical protein